MPWVDGTTIATIPVLSDTMVSNPEIGGRHEE